MQNKKPPTRRVGYTKTPITVKEAAEMLRLSPKTIYNRGAATEKLTRLRFGGSIRLIRQEVEALIDAKSKKPKL